jgi:hypothetical protein
MPGVRPGPAHRHRGPLRRLRGRPGGHARLTGVSCGTGSGSYVTRRGAPPAAGPTVVVPSGCEWQGQRGHRTQSPRRSVNRAKPHAAAIDTGGTASSANNAPTASSTTSRSLVLLEGPSMMPLPGRLVTPSGATARSDLSGDAAHGGLRGFSGWAASLDHHLRLSGDVRGRLWRFLLALTCRNVLPRTTRDP